MSSKPDLSAQQQLFLRAGAGIGDRPSLTERIHSALFAASDCSAPPDAIPPHIRDLLNEACVSLELYSLLRAQDFAHWQKKSLEREEMKLQILNMMRDVLKALP